MRYKLMMDLGGQTTEVEGQRKKTKKEINRWVEDNIKMHGLDWRVGSLIKFRNSSAIFNWVWIKNEKPVKHWI